MHVDVWQGNQRVGNNGCNYWRKENDGEETEKESGLEVDTSYHRAVQCKSNAFLKVEVMHYYSIPLSHASHNNTSHHFSITQKAHWRSTVPSLSPPANAHPRSAAHISKPVRHKVTAIEFSICRHVLLVTADSGRIQKRREKFQLEKPDGLTSSFSIHFCCFIYFYFFSVFMGRAQKPPRLWDGHGSLTGHLVKRIGYAVPSEIWTRKKKIFKERRVKIGHIPTHSAYIDARPGEPFWTNTEKKKNHRRDQPATTVFQLVFVPLYDTPATVARLSRCVGSVYDD